jgi:acylphosphatase
MVSENRKIMIRKLIDIWNDKDFLLGVNVHLKTEENVSKMIEWLEKHQNEQIESDEVLLKAMEIRYGERLNVNGLTTRD